MRGLTQKQKNMLEFIKRFIVENSMAPTVYEIADHFDIKTSTVHAHLKSLEKKRYITRSSKARSITLTHQSDRPATHMSFVMPVPLLGRINAGLPVENEEHQLGRVYCEKSLIGSASQDQIFALEVYGESMRDVGIYENDIVIVKQTVEIKPGDIVAALVSNESTVKFYFRAQNNMVELRPANPNFTPQYYQPEEVDIQGVVIGLQRKYR